MDEAVHVLLCYLFLAAHGCPKLEDVLVFDICKADMEVVNGSSSGFLRVNVQPFTVDCNCTLSTPTTDYLTVAVYPEEFFPHSLNVFAGAVNKISLNAGFVGNRVGSGYINRTTTWQLNLSRNRNIRRGSETSRNQSICMGFNTEKADLAITCRASYYTSGRPASATLRKVTMSLLISVPVLLVLLLVVIVLAFVCYRKGRSRAEYELADITHVSADEEKNLCKATTRKTSSTKFSGGHTTNPDICAGHVTDSSVDGFDENGFPLPPPEAYT